MAGNGDFQVRDMRKHPYIWYDKAIVKRFGKELGAYGHAVYAALAVHADNEGQDCYPSYSTIAEYYGMSRRQVIREIEKLVKLKLIAVEVQTVSNSMGKGKETNRFYLLEIPPVTSDYQSNNRDMTSDYQSPVTTSPTTSDYQSPPLVTTSHPNYTHENYKQLTNTHERDNAQALENIISISKVHNPLDPDIEQLKGKWIKTLDLNCPTDRWFATHSALYGKKAMLAAIYEAGNRNEPIRDKRYVLAIAKNFTPARLEAYTDDGYPKPKPATNGFNGRSTFATGGNRTPSTSKSEFERLRALPVEQQPNGGRWFANP